MLQRFSFLSKLPYDQLLIKNAILSTNNPARNIVNSILYSGNMNYDATVRGAQEVSNSVSYASQQTVGAIQSSTDALSSKMNNLALANIFGSLMVVGAVAVSTKILSGKLDKIAVGIDRLGAQFTEGFSLLSTKLDITNNALTGIKDQLEKIYETLKSPTLTQATEWRNLGLKRLGNELFPEAIEAFEKAVEYESTDPISNLMLGKLFLDAVDTSYNFHDPSKSNEYFQKAVRYAAASSREVPELKEVHIEALYLRSIALMLKASKIKLTNPNESEYLAFINESLSVIDFLLTIAPDHSQAAYQRAKLLVILNKKDECFNELVKLIDTDFDFLFTVYRDDDFIEFSSIGEELVIKYSPSYSVSLKEVSVVFYELLAEITLNKITIPKEVNEWLSMEKIETKEKGLNYFNSLTLHDCVKKPLDYRNIITLANTKLKSLVDSFYENRERSLTEFKRKKVVAMSEINMEYIAGSLFPMKLLKSFKDIDDYYNIVLNSPSLLEHQNTTFYFEDLSNLGVISQKTNEVMNELQNYLNDNKGNNAGYFLMACSYEFVILIMAFAIGSATSLGTGIASFFILVVVLAVLMGKLKKNNKKTYVSEELDKKLPFYSSAFKEYLMNRLFKKK